MIKNRPESHRTLPHYIGLPEPPYELDLDKIPDLIKLMLFPMRHVEPLSTDLLAAIDPIIDDYPHEDEEEFYRKQNSSFQLVFLVVNSIFGKDKGDRRILHPYSLSLIPSTKRGQVQESKSRFVSSMKEGGLLREELAYLQIDPFKGDWGLFSQLGLIAEMGKSNAYMDELGIVYDYFFLRTQVDLETVAQPSIGIEGTRQKRFMRHRARLLYTPFKDTSARQIWGVENGLELFFLQEMVRQGLPWPTIQAQIYDDGGVFPSLYHAWSERETMNDQHFITEVDFCFEREKIAVFCDGANHKRKKNIVRDTKIDQRLKAIGFKSIRVRSEQIQKDIRSSVTPLAEHFS